MTTSDQAVQKALTLVYGKNWKSLGRLARKRLECLTWNVLRDSRWNVKEQMLSVTERTIGLTKGSTGNWARERQPC